MIAKAVQSVLERDSLLAREVRRTDDVIDDMMTDLEHRCVELLARQQPMASDLRLIFAVLKTTTDLERLADSAVGIARKARRLNKMPPGEMVFDLAHYVNLVQRMLRESLQAFVHHDTALAREVAGQDEEIDDLYRDYSDRLLTYMRAAPENVERGANLLLILRLVERMGDHAVNIAERIYYLETGRELVIEGAESEHGAIGEPSQAIPAAEPEDAD
jgi:phosphate transport system protein